jgi:hypothetical protein
MSRRKGELSSASIDRGWPHQVALPESRTMGPAYVTVHLFCEGLSLCQRGHTFHRDDQYWHVFCFAQKADAEKFSERFGGEMMTPTTRPRIPW